MVSRKPRLDLALWLALALLLAVLLALALSRSLSHHNVNSIAITIHAVKRADVLLLDGV